MKIRQTARRCAGSCLLLLMFLASAMQPAPLATAHPLAQTTPTAPPAGGAQALITRNTNIRSQPSTSAEVLIVARPGERYPITGQSADGAWWRIDYNGQSAWLFASLVQVEGETAAPVAEAGDSPVLLPTPTPVGEDGDGSVLLPTPTPSSATTPTGQALRNANVRHGPGLGYEILATARAGERFPITGKSADGAWWRIEYQGEAGWIFASLVQVEESDEVAVASVEAPEPPPPSAPASAPVARLAHTAQFDPQRTRVRLAPVLGGLGQPVHITHAGDGSGRLFVVERAGRIRVYPGPQTEGQIFLEIEDRVGDSGPEQGMFSVAFPPNFSTTGHFFVNYTNNDGNTVIARYRVSENPNRADRESESVVLFLRQPARNHNGGMLLFGPDGRLWIGMGDGGGANDTFQNGQNPGSLLGKMLRIDVTSDPSRPYLIPADNPWVAATWNGQEVLDEIWAIGLRNPWRYSFDRRTGDLWIADVGESMSEEVNYIPASQVRQGGFNFGWPLMEGPHCRIADCATAGFVAPVTEYGHAGNGCSITGGYVYRGQAFPQLDGVYFFADYCSGNIWGYWRSSSGAAQTALLLPKAAAISSFGEDEAGELYATDIGGGVVYQLTAENVANAQP